MPPLLKRPRRLRRGVALRNMVAETAVTRDDLVLPLFIKAGQGLRTPIQSMPGHCQWSLDTLPEELARIAALKLPAVLLFGIPEIKDAVGRDALSDQGIIPQAVRLIKSLYPDLLVITDVCFCEYTDHGHCGVLSDHEVDNDATLLNLVTQAVCHAKAGADIIAPSGMMDGMVRALREGLDQAGFSHIPILSYAVKYASALYGPFREAAEGAPQFGDRRTYQMDPRNSAEGLREAQLDVEEGADLLMVKPAQYYLDVITRVKQRFPELPLVAYQVSGEFAMIKAAADAGWLDHDKVMWESMIALKRAGADIIITYFAKELAVYAARESV
ncbi:MAG: delta-aminolevulinic acid dehydratase [Gammaproteobacteria bacterium RIFCSPHIGHO2_12_FULL_45_9]|nr:MAG: delta-aminolevulinic acid dehydratase [Gammaproteobacteria bacterium RIFCSPHIGHO2_12_FULL_45_9]